MPRSVTMVIALVLVGYSFANGAPEDQDVFTDFESFDTMPGDTFSLGTAPQVSTFSGDAFAGVAGIGELYFSGLRAWMVNPGGTGVIEFDTNAATVEFWTRIRTGATGPSVYTAFDDLDQVISEETVSTPGPFQLLSFTGNIARIEIRNNAAGAGMMNSVDDFGFTPIPEPTAIVLGFLAIATLATPWRRLRSGDRAPHP